MIVLGAVLLVLAALFTLGSAFDGTQIDYSVFGISINQVTVGSLFLTGLVTGAVAMLALWMLLGGGVRKRSRSLRRKREVSQVRGQAETLEQENLRLREEIAGSSGSETVTAEDRRRL